MALSAYNLGTAQSHVSTTLVVTCANNVSIGDVILVFLSYGGGTVVPTAPTDSGLNTYTLLNSNTTLNSGNSSILLWASTATAALTTSSIITVNCPLGSATCNITGVTGQGTLDLNTTSTGGFSTTPSITSGTPSSSGELFIGFAGTVGNNTHTWTQSAGGWSSPPNFVNGSSGIGAGGVEGGNQVNAGTGTLTYHPVVSTTVNWGCFLLSYPSGVQDILSPQIWM